MECKPAAGNLPGLPAEARRRQGEGLGRPEYFFLHTCNLSFLFP
jgi:hypothetical protein